MCYNEDDMKVESGLDISGSLTQHAISELAAGHFIYDIPFYLPRIRKEEEYFIEVER